jgi:hypothetical protein
LAAAQRVPKLVFRGFGVFFSGTRSALPPCFANLAKGLNPSGNPIVERRRQGTFEGSCASNLGGIGYDDDDDEQQPAAAKQTFALADFIVPGTARRGRGKTSAQDPATLQALEASLHAAEKRRAAEEEARKQPAPPPSLLPAKAVDLGITVPPPPQPRALSRSRKDVKKRETVDVAGATDRRRAQSAGLREKTRQRKTAASRSATEGSLGSLAAGARVAIWCEYEDRWYSGILGPTVVLDSKTNRRLSLDRTLEAATGWVLLRDGKGPERRGTWEVTAPVHNDEANQEIRFSFCLEMRSATPKGRHGYSALPQRGYPNPTRTTCYANVSVLLMAHGLRLARDPASHYFDIAHPGDAYAAKTLFLGVCEEPEEAALWPIRAFPGINAMLTSNEQQDANRFFDIFAHEIINYCPRVGHAYEHAFGFRRQTLTSVSLGAPQRPEWHYSLPINLTTHFSTADPVLLQTLVRTTTSCCRQRTTWS